jgi:arylformamidase
VEAALAISGIFDLEPIRHCYLQEKLRLTVEEVQVQSPVHRLNHAGKPVHVVVGGHELPELRRQSAGYAARRKGLGLPVSTQEIAGLNHFSILEHFRLSHTPEVAAQFGLPAFVTA